MANRKGSGAVEKKFNCTHDGCKRAFTRQEHLQRHYQNHAGGDFTCDRCRAHFKRRDLLDRHVTRHEQKDAEGSSLMTRKRSWKDADGNIVTKKPAIDHDAAGAGDGKTVECITFLSPPQSSDAIQPDLIDFEALEAPMGFMSTVPDPTDMTNATLDPSISLWDQHNTIVPQDNDIFVDTFNPDTASSFNQPFTTMNNYNWLFNLDLSSVDEFAIDDLGCHPFPQSQGEIPPFDTGNLTDSQQLSNSRSQMVLPPDFGDFSSKNSRSTCQPNTQPNQALLNSDFPVTVATSESPQSPSDRHDLSSASSQAGVSTNATSVSSGRCLSKTKLTAARNSTVNIDLERPMTLLNSSARLPKLDALARSHVLKLIESIRPTTPDGQQVTADHPFLSSSALQTYSDLFFTRFNATYPLIHLASFEPSRVDTLLLLSILLLGATYCEKDAHQIAVCVHDVLRPQIFAHSSFSALPELWVLQTILLVECFGKSRAGQKQHDMSHLFHGLLINLIRRSDCQTARPENSVGVNGDLEDDWKAWIDSEQKKRLALLCFMWDTQHAVLFCQSLCMSAFELRCSLPCDQSLWEAESAESWQRLRHRQNVPPLLLTLLKSYVNGQVPAEARKLNSLSRVLLLHGLMSIAWDMGRRDQTSLGVVGSSALGDWHHRIASAYDTWKADFDAYTMSTTQILSATSSNLNPVDQDEARKGFAIYTTANSALYHSAHVILFSDFLDIQIYAGARHLLGRPVGREDYIRSQRVVKRWANAQNTNASKAAWHASHIIKEAVMNLKDFDAGGLFIHPWCLYLATITIWSFHHARTGRNTARSAEDEEDEMIWDAQADMNALIGSMTSGTVEQLSSSSSANSRRTNTAGLTAVVSRYLSKVRWAIVRDGMLVLRGLVPWRLISEAEA